jgi:hypothetical protein
MEQPMSSIRQAGEVEWKELLTKGVATGTMLLQACYCLKMRASPLQELNCQDQ